MTVITLSVVKLYKILPIIIKIIEFLQYNVNNSCISCTIFKENYIFFGVFVEKRYITWPISGLCNIPFKNLYVSMSLF